ncbi:MAG: hypothetical protein IJY44_06240 [Bacteroidaceae bacterium]|nr:hypothetical protein [Bacteroidaceae bacterium]
MKNLVKNILIVCGLTLMVACSGPSKKELQATVDSLNVELAQLNTEMEEVMGIFNDINEGFRQINEAENRVNVQNAENAPANVKEQVKSDMAFIQAKMKENRELIAELEAKVSKGDKQSAQLRRTIKSLKADLEAKEQQIAALQAELEAKNARIGELDAQVASLDAQKNDLIAKNNAISATAANQDKALNAAWYIVDKKKSLKELSVLTKRNKVMNNADVNKEGFTAIDIRNVAEIALGAKKAKVLSTHPEGSYELVKGEDGLLTLNIVDAQKFWSVTRYLVVRVK